ncbi:MAG: hypothetical protein EOO13_11270 [Chitinophagaceae bacterium]|nr:MAG: hypothetical protein EOO13_11270 [Chitinophagaceae bacterium]
MKQIVYFLLLVLTGFTATAQNPTFSPATFTAEDQVTFTIDVTGTGMAGVTDAYLWIFSNPDIGGGTDGVTNGSWGNSSEAAKLTPAGPNKFSYTFTGTTMFGQTPAQLKTFGFLLKKKDGSAQTPDYKPFAFDPLIFVPSLARIFPAKVDKDDVVSVNFDQSYATTVNDQRMSPLTFTVVAYDDLGTAVGAPLTRALTKTEPTIWSGSFIPTASFTPAAGRTLAKFRYKFNGTVLDVNGATTPVSTQEWETVFTKMQ